MGTAAAASDEDQTETQKSTKVSWKFATVAPVRIYGNDRLKPTRGTRRVDFFEHDRDLQFVLTFFFYLPKH